MRRVVKSAVTMTCNGVFFIGGNCEKFRNKIYYIEREYDKN